MVKYVILRTIPKVFFQRNDVPHFLPAKRNIEFSTSFRPKSGRNCAQTDEAFKWCRVAEKPRGVGISRTQPADK